MHKNNCFSVYISRAVIGGHFDTKIVVIDQADQKLWDVIGAPPPPPRGKILKNYKILPIIFNLQLSGTIVMFLYTT